MSLKGFNLPYPGSSNTVIDYNRNIYSVISKNISFALLLKFIKLVVIDRPTIIHY